MSSLIMPGDQGIDTAVRVPVDVMNKYRFTYIVRYISRYESSWKNVTPAEIAAYHAAGIRVLLVWEQSVATPLDGRAGGLRDGLNAYGWARRLGYPEDVPILVAVDTDVYSKNIQVVYEYVRGFSENIKPYKMGIYGDADILIKAGPLSVLGWLPNASAWSSARKAEAMQLGLVDVLQQKSYYLDGKYGVDGNIVVQPFPGWLPGSDIPPGPDPDPAPVPPVSDSILGEFMSTTNVFASDGTSIRYLYNGFVLHHVFDQEEANILIAAGLVAGATYTAPVILSKAHIARMKAV